MPAKLIVATTRPCMRMGVMACRTAMTVTSTVWLKTPNRKLIAMSNEIVPAVEPCNAGTHSSTPSASTAEDTSTTP
jgi:hypothetical protein